MSTPAQRRRVAAARTRARYYRLSLHSHGGTFTLRNRKGVALVTGKLDDITDHLGGFSRRREIALPAAWVTIVEDYATSLAAVGRSPQTVQLRREQLARLARDTGKAPGEVTDNDLVRWFARHDWKPETRRSYRSGVMQFFGWAHKLGHLPTNPAADLEPVKQPPAVARPADEHAYRAAVAAATPREQVMLRLAAEAGLRRGEVAQVRPDNLIGGAGGTQLLVRGKGDKTRLVPLSDGLAALVRAGARGHSPELVWQGDDGGWLFPDYLGGHVSPPRVGQLVSRRLPPAVTMHMLRHMFATRAYRGSRNLRAVQMLLGHSSLAITERYVAVNDDEVRAAAMAAAI